MKRILILAAVLLLILTATATADRTVDADTCSTIDEYLSKVEYGTIVSFTGYRSGINERDGDYYFMTYIRKPGLQQRPIYVYCDKAAAEAIPYNTGIHVTGPASFRNNAIYIDSRAGTLEPAALIHEPVTYNLDEIANLKSMLNELWIGDTVTCSNAYIYKIEKPFLYFNFYTNANGNYIILSYYNEKPFFKNDHVSFTAELTGYSDGAFTTSSYNLSATLIQ